VLAPFQFINILALDSSTQVLERLLTHLEKRMGNGSGNGLPATLDVALTTPQPVLVPSLLAPASGQV
jgi:hypothetical protein